ncbi:nucleotidyltransferase family protein [Arthrobacter sp. MAHUQ-56]
MRGETEESLLGIPEGVLLGHALVQRVADTLGIRSFFIKGPASVVQGLRQPKTSTDVDVFVEPADLDQLLHGLRERGWLERPVDPDSRTFPKHSVTLHHPEWPCCIDVHFRFPGMEESAADCFDVMWENIEILELAGQELRVPSKPLGILVLALHALRAPHLPASGRDLDHLGHVTKEQSHVSSIMDIAASTGSLAALRPFVEPLLPVDTVVIWPEPSDEWRNRIASKEPGSARLIAILQAPWVDRPHLILRAVFPSPESLLSRNLYADMALFGRIAQHRGRWGRFLRGLPRLVRDLQRL